MATDNDKYTQLADRKELWKVISKLEKQAIDLLSVGDDDSTENAYKLLAQSIGLKNNDPFFNISNCWTCDNIGKSSAAMQMVTVSLNNDRL
jgi:hypothetical protein